MQQLSKTVVVTDVDNTLLDWVSLWHATFSAMLDRLLQKSGADRETLLDEIRTVHQKHGTSEYAFLIEELPSLRDAAGGVPPAEFYEDAIAEYGRVRRQELRLYPGVMDCLAELRSRGVLIIAYTESLAYYTGYRFRKLGLDTVVDRLYSPADHDLPTGLTAEELRRYPASHYELAVTKHFHTPAGELKPNPRILLEILADVGASASDAVYVGDSLTKDVAMAQSANVLDAFAAYGAAQNTEAYELLRRVTHWPDEAVISEKDMVARPTITPTLTLDAGFGDLLDKVDFKTFDRQAA
jgi:phosphoglycolate phosphatase